MTDSQPMNAMDRSMLGVNRALRGIGWPEFSTQALVWLGGRVDASRLGNAVVRLSQRYPVLTSRLLEGGRNGPVWSFRPGAECALHEIDLASDKPEAVLDFAARRLADPGAIATHDPIQFHLLHRPDGRDVLLMQYSHALMDNSDAIPLLREIDQLFGSSAGPETPRPPAPDLLSEYLRRFPRGRRLKAALRTLDMRFRKLRRPPVTLGKDLDSPPVPLELRIATRKLPRVEARAFEQHVVRTCGMPSLSMALLGSAFRALGKWVPGHQKGNLVAGIGVDLGAANLARPVFQTLASVVPIFVRPTGVADREGLMRALHQQFRQRLEHAADLGTVQLANFLQQPGAFLRQRLANRLVRRLLRKAYSLWFAYFGSLDAVGEQFCGAAIVEVRYCASAWPPMGLTLLVNRYRGDLLFQATYVPASVPEPLVNAFLDTLLADLRP